MPLYGSVSAPPRAASSWRSSVSDAFSTRCLPFTDKCRRSSARWGAVQRATAIEGPFIMLTEKILFAGGCHIVGHPVGAEYAFPRIAAAELQRLGIDCRIKCL